MECERISNWGKYSMDNGNPFETVCDNDWQWCKPVICIALISDCVDFTAALDHCINLTANIEGSDKLLHQKITSTCLMDDLMAKIHVFIVQLKCSLHVNCPVPLYQTSD